ncbi:MAG: toll/interleukin-1 receptor domain-containing protein [Candidatus Binataceae bacterium]
MESRELREILSTHWLNHPIDELERYADAPPDSTVALPFPLEAIRGSAQQGINLPEYTGVKLTPHEFSRVIDVVRNELLTKLLAAKNDSADPAPIPAEWDVFISHASEDKDAFVRPLAEALQKRGLKVWFDEFTVKVGDSLRRSIDRGLAKSRFGVVVISPDFLRKEWPQKELDGLVAREVDGVRVILPVWHKITRKQILAYSPPLADRYAASSERGLDHVVSELVRAIAGDDPAAQLPNSNREVPVDGGRAQLTNPGSPKKIVDLWVNMEYPQKLGLIEKLEADGYDLKWDRATDEATSIDIEGWEHVTVDRPDGTCARLKIRDAPFIGGYMVLLKKKKTP